MSRTQAHLPKNLTLIRVCVAAAPTRATSLAPGCPADAVALARPRAHAGSGHRIGGAGPRSPSRRRPAAITASPWWPTS